MSTCLTCLNWQPKRSGAMAAQGFALCKLGALWTYLAPHHTCPQHQAAAREVAAARRVWLDNQAPDMRSNAAKRKAKG